MTSKLYLTKRINGYYYIGFFEGGSRKWRTAQCTTKSDASLFLRRFEGRKKDLERTPLLPELFSRFESNRCCPIRPSTMTNYRLAVNHFNEVFGDKVIDQYTVSYIERFKNAQLEQKVSTISVNIWLRGIKSVLGFAVKHEWLTKNPVQRSLEFAIPRQSLTYVSKDNFRTLLGKVKEPILRDLFLFAALSGLRLSEILNLKWSAVDFEKEQFTVFNSDTFTTKTGKKRTVPMHE